MGGDSHELRGSEVRKRKSVRPFGVIVWSVGCTRKLLGGSKEGETLTVSSKQVGKEGRKGLLSHYLTYRALLEESSSPGSRKRGGQRQVVFW